ncbi:DUF349 domain-containing protein [Rhodococcus artemisiae]|uniref:DUF349 domain-containing protein n=1 Tax=Rhodococcus artemisiae TaxID=714159 RepID=A0ABU7L4B1_9NOCA|nr:DUF349 domain-containing protein [Rhodococcus artemisiae]MEE2056374.1 DUF349 domain-containing protein [Rhodococcus artemisiae]
MTDPNAQDPTPEQVSGTPPRPGPPKPGAPRPGAPRPAPTERTTESEHAPKPHPVPGQTHPHAPAVPASDPSKFGRVDEDGTAWVLTADGERCIGSWQAGNSAEGLEHFGRRYDDLATEVALLETRLTSGSGDAKKTRAAAEAILESLPTAAVIGDLDALATRLTGVIEESEKAAVAQKQEKEQHRAEATARKEALAAEAEEIGADSTHWKAAGDRLREILDEWKSIRGVDRKTDDVLWRRYSKAREAFNRRRGAHFAELDRERASAKTKKEELVARAEALQDSTDWGATAAAFRDLLAEWKASGRAPREADDQLWKRFKGAQDVFFAARNAASAERDAEFEDNARAKEALLESASTIDPAADLEAARTRLRELQERWEAIGKVPRDRMHDLEARLRAIEKRVREASDSEWRRTDPEALARAAQFRERVQQFEEQAEKAQAKGRTKDADAALAQAAQWREWAEAAESAVGER